MPSTSSTSSSSPEDLTALAWLEAYRVLHDRQEADDVAQATMARHVERRIGQLDEEAQRRWVWRVAHNKALDKGGEE